MPTSSSTSTDVIVIGGGASGMMAAGIAASRGKKVLLLEKNSQLGCKLAISGGGRCNITNAQLDLRTLLKNYGSAEPFLYSTFSQFSVQSTFDFFTKQHLPLVEQAKQRVFPQTQNALDVVKTFYHYLQTNQVEIKTDTLVTNIESDTKSILSVQTTQANYSAKSYILATGGVSHPETGSTGDGFAWLKQLGHTVKNPSPTIVPLAVSDVWIKKLAGVTLPQAKITFYLDNQKQITKTGDILLTHFGLSGPVILNAAKQVGDLLQAGIVTAHIDLFPTIDQGNLEKLLIQHFDANKNKALKTVIKKVVLSSMVNALATLLPTINFDTKVHSVTKEQRKQIARQLKTVPLTISGLMGFDRAVVADGGVSLDQIDTKTMQSKLISNLYITGDLLNINRPSGGFSLQLCWTTGFVAGSSV